jgi:hypothetical protein
MFRIVNLIMAVLLGLGLAMAPASEPVASAKAHKCGHLTYSLYGSTFHGSVVRYHYACHTARRILAHAVKKGVSFGVELPTPKGWICYASQRSEEGDMSKNIVTCGRGKHGELIHHVSFAIRYPY